MIRRTVERRRKGALAAGAVLVVVAGAAGCGASAASGSGSSSASIAIGMSDVLSGPVAGDCAPVAYGAQAWIDHVNKGGGVNGRHVELNLKDDQNSATQALANARTFVQANDVAILGGCGSTPVSAITPYAQGADMPFLFPLAGNDTALSIPYNAYTFNLYGYYGAQMSTLVKAAFSQYGKGSTYIVNTNSTGSQASGAQIASAVQKYKGSVAGNDYIAASTTDYSPEALKIKKANPAYVVLVLGNTQSAQLITALAAQNALPAKKILIIGGAYTSGFIQSVGTAISKTIEVNPTPAAVSPPAKTCDGALEAAKVPVVDYSVWGCVEAQVLVNALGQIQGTVTRSSLVDTLNKWRGVKASPVIEPVTFADKNHNGLATFYEIAIRNGKPFNVKVIG
jgi:ABC-type branched-subunit amino acid transport system substrate-binding protein